MHADGCGPPEHDHCRGRPSSKDEGPCVVWAVAPSEGGRRCVTKRRENQRKGGWWGSQGKNHLFT
jgi:hypothetical protein